MRISLVFIFADHPQFVEEGQTQPSAEWLAPLELVLQPTVRARSEFPGLDEWVIDEQISLSVSSFCFRAGTNVDVDLGDVLISGIPCIDLSTYRCQTGLSGPTDMLILTWARLLQIHLQTIVMLVEVEPVIEHWFAFSHAS